ncbi:pyridoxamine 5'-phosphate oxidase family protein [Rhizobiales bacterium]|uniref:pyridoxamine 5'-phosphate oxidase family protein n=1 Tax=Hongsoonwoonella zoysiae TaxID=2821844 RepID=UPI0015614A38|nr:pyridoxamine 5'-phosphate oxidase family protein [Hongsoonwoonella zoysiae]NRG18786.1 pyridoxamine 5'-phosphate oxidase family protein [Hongsoonwoonella zoysiae]
MSGITTIEELEAIYGTPAEASTVKVLDHVSPLYRRFIEASPFVALATCGPDGLDCSPRGDQPGFMRIADENTLMLPDRRGNNRGDSLKNIILDPRVSLMFLVPGSGNTIRVNGRAKISTDEELCNSFAIKGKAPRTVIVITVDEVYFQCARAIIRADLWNPDQRKLADGLPSPGDYLTEATNNGFDGETYDKEWPERAAKTLW